MHEHLIKILSQQNYFIVENNLGFVVVVLSEPSKKMAVIVKEYIMYHVSFITNKVEWRKTSNNHIIHTGLKVFIRIIKSKTGHTHDYIAENELMVLNDGIL